MLNHSQFSQLLPTYLRERAAQRPLVLATLIGTQGSSYRKAGAQMLFTQDGQQIGLLSGGCLESDLREHARAVLTSRQPQIVQYDLRQPDDEIFGLGAGCAGALDIFLQSANQENQWQPLTCLHEHWQQHVDTRMGLVIRSNSKDLPAGSMILDEHHAYAHDGSALDVTDSLLKLYANATLNQVHELEPGIEVFMLGAKATPKLLILGGGMDAQPLAQQAAFLGWQSTVYDHRPAYAESTRFPQAERVIAAAANQLVTQIDLDQYQAAIVMSHHLASDLSYLKQLARSAIPYVGLLGPAARRERLFAAMQDELALLKPRLHAPVGLNIHAETPEAIALAIIAEIYQSLAELSRTGHHS